MATVILAGTFVALNDSPDKSHFRRFVTFYFTNFSSQLSNFFLRKGFEVCGMLEEVVVPRKRNTMGGFTVLLDSLMFAMSASF